MGVSRLALVPAHPKVSPMLPNIGRMEQKKRSHVKMLTPILRPVFRLLNRIPDFAGINHNKIKFCFGQGFLGKNINNNFDSVMGKLTK